MRLAEASENGEKTPFCLLNRMPHMPAKAQARYGLLILIAGAMIDSTSGLFTRLITADAMTTNFWRGILAGLIMLAVVIWRDGSQAPRSFLRIGLPGAGVVLFNCLGMIGNIVSLKLTTVANFFMIFATAPFVAAILARIVLKERVDLATLLAATAGLAGVIIMMAGSAGSGHLAGDLIAVAVIFVYAITVLIMKGMQGLDLPPVLCLTMLLSGLMGAPFASPLSISAHDAGLLVLFAGIQLALGNVLIYTAVKRIPAAQAGLLGVLDAAFAPVWVFLFIGEVPPQATLIGGGIVMLTALAHLVWTLTRPAQPAAAVTAPAGE